jgi:acylphosphatase
VPDLPAQTAKRPLVTQNPTSEARLTVWVHGRVQGVGMRWWIRTRALEIGLTGWARNLADGRVEVVAEGPAQACGALLAALAPSPPRLPDSSRPGRIDAAIERWSGATGAVGPGFAER